MDAHLNLLNIEGNETDPTTRFAGKVTYDHAFKGPMGINADFTLGAQAQHYWFFEDQPGMSIVEKESARLTPFGVFDFNWPFFKNALAQTHMLIPRLQFVWSDNHDQGEFPNLDSRFIEHDTVSLFNENRFTGFDQFEDGMRINFGVNYQYFDKEHEAIDVGFGRIFHPDIFDEYDSSDEAVLEDAWVGYIQYALPEDAFTIHARGTLDRGWNLSKIELGVDHNTDDSQAALDWVYLEPEPSIGFDDKRSEIAFKGDYFFGENWQLDYDLSYEAIERTPLDLFLGMTYGNECVEASFGLEQDHTRDAGAPSETSFVFSMKLLGLTGKPKREWKPSRCVNASFL